MTHEVMVLCSCDNIEQCRMASIHVFPNLAKGDSADLLVADAHAFPNSSTNFTRCSAPPYLPNLLLGQHRVVPVDAPAGSLGVFPQAMGISKMHAAFGNCISDVVGVRSDKQVIRANASPDVAVVTDAHPFGDRPEVQFPRETMGIQHRGGAPGNKAAAANAAIASAVVYWALPEPALVGFEYARPESVGDRDATSMLIGHRSLLLRCQPPAGINGAGA